mgnify:CR=1 FL=1
MTDEQVREKAKEFQNLLKRLRNVLDPAFVKVEGFFEHSVVFSFKDFKIVVSIQKAIRREFHSTEGLLLLNDQNFKLLDSFSKNKLKNLEQEDGSLYLDNALRPFLKTETVKAKAQVNVKKIYYFELKSLLNKAYSLNQDPSKEFFLFGNDELRKRFNQSNVHLKITSKGIKVEVQDKSALLFTNDDGSRFMDLHYGQGFLSKNYLYLGNLMKYKEVKKPKDGVDYSVRVNGDGTKIYMVSVLKDGIDLKTTPRIAYEKADGKSFVLKKSKGEFYLEDEKGKISIGHPDLLIRVL